VTEGKQIFDLIPKVMKEIGAVGKDRKNPQQNYSFRGIDDFYNAVQPALCRHGVFIVPTVIEQNRQDRQTKSGTNMIYTVLTVKHVFYAPDGSSIEAVTVGEAMDSGDKSANKAMSAAMKYALIEVFSIPTEGDNDTENNSPEVAAPFLEQLDDAFKRRKFSPEDADAAIVAVLAGWKVGDVERLSGSQKSQLLELINRGHMDKYKHSNGKPLEEIAHV
jgi:hypothetical protein